MTNTAQPTGPMPTPCTQGRSSARGLRSRFRASALERRARSRMRRQDRDFRYLLNHVSPSLRSDLVAAYARQS